MFFALSIGVVAGSMVFASPSEPATNWEQIRKEIAETLDNADYDDGSYGPVLIRLAWHAAGTFCKVTKTGGSDGSTMRFDPEASYGANAGLAVARDLLEPIKKLHPEISYADLWSFASCVAIEEMGGPKIQWRPGRKDEPDNKRTTPNGRLPDASQAEEHIRDIFYRMGFNDREIVALSGAHALGRCHRDRSGFEGPWTNAPTTVSNEYFVALLNRRWRKRRWDGPEQYEDETQKLMMLPTDIALLHDVEFRKLVELYAVDEEAWRQDFAAAYGKLQELGVSAFQSNVCPVKKQEGLEPSKKKGWFW